MLKEKIENWEKEFDEKLVKEIKGCWIVYRTAQKLNNDENLELNKAMIEFIDFAFGHPHQNLELKSFVHQLLRSEKEKLLERIKLEKWQEVNGGYRRKDRIGMATNVSYCEGYNQAVDDLEKLKKETQYED